MDYLVFLIVTILIFVPLIDWKGLFKITKNIIKDKNKE